MKDCPYCAEPIQARAIFCKHCKTRLDGADPRLGPSPGPPQEEPAPGMQYLIPVQTSTTSIIAGYSGLLCPGPVSLIVSLLAIRELKANPKLHGWGRAIFGLIMGILGCVGIIWMLAMGGFDR